MTKRFTLFLLTIVVASGVAFSLGYVSHSAPSTSSTAVTTTTTDEAQPATAMWPFAGTSLRFSDPVTAASSFAVSYLGFSAPVVGAFQQGDSRSGEVPVRSSANGAVTTVLVRQLSGDDSWWVLGAATANIQITRPSLLANVSSPATLRGVSTAFEAQVNVELRGDQSLAAIGTSNVMGGSMGQLESFEGQITFANTSSRYGTLLMRTYSAKDGSVLEAAALRIMYAK
jgi:Immunoglobulin-like domain of bacterial spore germination